jgi:hypothetical protein
MPVDSHIRSGTKYLHLEIGKDIATGIAGYYTLLKEVRLPFNGREVLYIVGRAVLEASCCGTGDWTYATVPGYLVGWKTSTEAGLPASDIEPMLNEAEREEVQRIIQDKEFVEVVHFW